MSAPRAAGAPKKVMGPRRKKAMDKAAKLSRNSDIDSVNTFYAHIDKLLGSNVLLVTTIPLERMEKGKKIAALHPEQIKCRIPGKFRKSVWVNEGDFIAISKESDNKAQICGEFLFPLNAQQIRALPSSAVTRFQRARGIVADNVGDDGEIIFDDGSEDELPPMTTTVAGGGGGGSSNADSKDDDDVDIDAI